MNKMDKSDSEATVPPRRIHVTGNAGAGKTTLATALGERLNLPVFYLDSIVWQSGWVKTTAAERQPQELAWCTQEAWIIEGVSPLARQHADRVLVLDTPAWQCLWRAGKRNLPYAFRSRPGLPPNCPEIKILPQLLRIITRFDSTVRQDLLGESKVSTKYRWLPVNTDVHEACRQLL